MRTLKTKRIFVLIWVILSLSALASIYTLFKGIMQFSANQLLFWMTVIKLVVMLILLLMSLNLWKIVNSYVGKSSWQPLYYQKLKEIGYWAIALTLLNAAFQLGYETLWATMNHSPINHTTIYWIQRFYAILLMESPAMWVLALSIFLFAELLKIANQFKAENESII
ncbi:MAG: hypothetical protein EOP42_19360 [Sphingobacteriaceae bacterium]|nr:MAG: hypothetical protein EOP42_19360 [Sphingobacteriaceae bacterium]